MTKLQAYKNEQAEICFLRKGRICLQCNELPANQLAHIIPQDVVMLKKYHWVVIHHWSNRDPVCDLACNSRRSIRNHPLDIEAKVAAIEETIREEEIHRY